MLITYCQSNFIYWLVHQRTAARTRASTGPPPRDGSTEMAKPSALDSVVHAILE